MSADIVAVLVVPLPGDPSGLLGDVTLDGTVVSRPPRVHRPWMEDYGSPTGGEHHPEWAPVEYDVSCEEPPYGGLPVWWEGALVPDGWDRLRRHMRSHALPRDPEPGNVRWAALVAQDLRLIARAVFLARVDGRLVEIVRGEGGCFTEVVRG